MAKPNIETWAHAERDRQRALEARSQTAQAKALEQYRYQVESMSGPSMTVAPSSMGILGGGSVGTWVSDGTYYYPSPPPSSIPPSSIIAVDAEGYSALQAELEEAKRTIAEQSEIIEALAADGDELDSLRAENEKLRAELFERPPEPPKANADGWIVWDGDDDGTPPPDAIVEIQWRDRFREPAGSGHASKYRWNHSGRGNRDADIVSYRIVG